MEFVATLRSFGALARGLKAWQDQGRLLSGGQWFQVLLDRLVDLGFAYQAGSFTHGSVGAFDWPWYTGHLGDLLLMEICGRGVAFLWQRPSAVQEGGRSFGLLQVLQHWFDSGCSPLAWREILMCSIPKGKEPRADGAVDVNGLRRISVECALWSLVASTFCRCDSVRHWALSWAPREFYGALQGRDCFSGLFFFFFFLNSAVNVDGEALAAMDLAKALRWSCG
eukprot:s6297_g6.t1